MNRMGVALVSLGVLAGSLVAAPPASAETVVRGNESVTVRVGETVTSVVCFASPDTPAANLVTVYLLGRLTDGDPMLLGTKVTGNQLDPARCPDSRRPYATAMPFTAPTEGTFRLVHCSYIQRADYDPSAVGMMGPIFVACIPAGTVIATNVVKVRCKNKKTGEKRWFVGRTECPKGWIRI